MKLVKGSGICAEARVHRRWNYDQITQQARQLTHHDRRVTPTVPLGGRPSFSPYRSQQGLEEASLQLVPSSHLSMPGLEPQQELPSHALTSTQRCFRSFTSDLVSAGCFQYSQTFAHYQLSSICSGSCQYHHPWIALFNPSPLRCEQDRQSLYPYTVIQRTTVSSGRDRQDGGRTLDSRAVRRLPIVPAQRKLGNIGWTGCAPLAQLIMVVYRGGRKLKVGGDGLRTWEGCSDH